MKKFWLLVLAASLGLPSLAPAAVILTIDTVTPHGSPYDQKGWFYIRAVHDEPTDPLIKGFDLKLDLDPDLVGGPGVSFCGVAEPEMGDAYDYVLPGGSFLASSVSLGSVSLSDTVPPLGDPSQGFDALVSGRAFAKIQYKVEADTQGRWPVVLDIDQSRLVGPDGASIDFMVENGEIHVLPEPASLVMLFVFAAALLFWFRGRPRRGPGL